MFSNFNFSHSQPDLFVKYVFEVYIFIYSLNLLGILVEKLVYLRYSQGVLEIKVRRNILYEMCKFFTKVYFFEMQA